MIGVIGGAGVAATNKLCALIEERKTRGGAFRDAHHPEMIIWQATQAPSRSMYYEGRGPSFIDDYVHVGTCLKQCGATRLAMSCNTAHLAIDELSEKIGLPFINLLAEVAKAVAKTGCQRVGMMCSDGLAKFKLYDKYIQAANPDARVIYPTAEYQKKVTQGICNAKNTKRFTPSDDPENPHALFSAVVRHLLAEGADCIVAGCTDIRNTFSPPPLIMQSGQVAPYIDSLEVLAAAIIAYSEENENHRN